MINLSFHVRWNSFQPWTTSSYIRAFLTVLNVRVKWMQTEIRRELRNKTHTKTQIVNYALQSKSSLYKWTVCNFDVFGSDVSREKNIAKIKFYWTQFHFSPCMVSVGIMRCIIHLLTFTTQFFLQTNMIRNWKHIRHLPPLDRKRANITIWYTIWNNNVFAYISRMTTTN